MTQASGNRPSKGLSAAARASRIAIVIAIALCLAALGAGLFFTDPQIVSRLLPTPVPACVQPTLTLGTTKFVIKTIARAADGSVAVPADLPDAAYWVDGTNVNYVFALSPASANLSLKDA